jgi:hypothetical protein
MWWEILIAIAVILVVGAGFVSFVRLLTGNLTRRTDRRAEDLYDAYADGPRRRRR